MSTPTLSILIPTLKHRREVLNRLMKVLQPQLSEAVEILVELDEGTLQTGTKRNRLVQRARGEYVAFVDDDDLVPADYCARILKAVEQKPDVCGLVGKMTVLDWPGQPSRPFYHSIEYGHWFERGGVFYRPPNHLNPVKREIALKVPFMDISFGEDRDYSQRLLPLLRTESPLGEPPIYYYLFVRKKPHPANRLEL